MLPRGLNASTPFYFYIHLSSKLILSNVIQNDDSTNFPSLYSLKVSQSLLAEDFIFFLQGIWSTTAWISFNSIEDIFRFLTIILQAAIVQEILFCIWSRTISLHFSNKSKNNELLYSVFRYEPKKNSKSKDRMQVYVRYTKTQHFPEKNTEKFIMKRNICCNWWQISENMEFFKHV